MLMAVVRIQNPWNADKNGYRTESYPDAIQIKTNFGRYEIFVLKYSLIYRYFIN